MTTEHCQQRKTITHQDSITVWFEHLRHGDRDAAEKLWNRFFDRLVVVARQQLANTNRRVADEEDIASGVMTALCHCADRGKLPTIESRDDLWRMLLAWVRNDVIDHVRKTGRLKRGDDLVRGDSVFESDQSSSANAGFNAVEDLRPSPATLAEMQEQLSVLLSQLPGDLLKQIAMKKMEGYLVDEIAEELSVSPRTIERKLKLIRSYWNQPPGVCRS